MIYAIVGILLIAFIAFVVLSAKAWHWVNIVFLSLCFLTGIGVVYAASKVLDARRSDMLKVQQEEKRLQDIERQIEQTVYGSGLSFEYAPDSLRGLSERLALEQAGRGRVWKHGEIETDGDNRVFKFAGNRQLSVENEKALENLTMFVFADRNFQEEVYPVLFVGIMKVIEEAPDALVMEPVFIADSKEFKVPSNSWTLFEKSPSDRRDAFLRDTAIELKEDDPNLNEKLTEYRKLLEEQYIPAAAFGLDLSNDENAGAYEQIVDRVMFDGLPLVKIESWIESQPNRINSRFDPANEEIFVKYQFNGASRDYKVNAEGNIETDGQFNKNGQAINPALHAENESIKFQDGDIIYVDLLTAEGYQRGEEPVPAFSSTEPVTEITRIFRRQLSDHPYLLRKLDREIKEYTAEIARIEENNKRSQVANDEANKQLQEREQQANLLRQDISGFENDLQLINGFLDQTRDAQESLQASIKQMENDIRSKHREMKATAQALRSNSQASPPGTPIQTSPILSAPIDNIQSLAPGQ